MIKEKALKVAARLEKHPHLLDRFEALLNIVENTSGKLDRADDAEEWLIEEIKKTGHDALQTWAVTQEEKKTREARVSNKELIAHTKKNFTGNQLTDK